MRNISEIRWDEVGGICIDWADTITLDVSATRAFLDAVTGIPIRVTTSAPAAQVERYFTAAGLSHYFGNAIIPNARKIDGQAFKEAAVQMQTSVESLLVIDDDQFAIEAACILGVYAPVWIKPKPRDVMRSEVFWISGLDELRATLPSVS